MAFKLSEGAQTVFFSKVFGPQGITTKLAQELVAAGVTFEVSLYGLTATVNGQPSIITLTAGTTALMKGTVEFAVAEQNKTIIAGWVKGLHAKVQPSPVVKQPVQQSGNPVVVTLHGFVTAKKLSIIKAVMQVAGLGLSEAKALVESSAYGPVPVVVLGGATLAEAAKSKLEDAGGSIVGLLNKPIATGTIIPPAVKPVDGVISLKDAQALGQKVHGTSPNSVYHTIAVSDHVKVAAKIGGHGSISLRAEWTDNPVSDLKKLEDAGLQMKTQYASLHFDTADVPLGRVIGAFLLGSGVKWKAIVMSGEDLVVNAKL